MKMDVMAAYCEREIQAAKLRDNRPFIEPRAPPKDLTLSKRLLDLFDDDPTQTSAWYGERIGTDSTNVRSILRKFGRKLARSCQQWEKSALLAIPVPRELLSPPDELAAFKAVSERHVPLPLGDPEPWRAAAAGWEQIGYVNAAHWDGNPKSDKRRTKPSDAPTAIVAKKVEPRAEPAVVKDCDLEGLALTPTARAVAGLCGCRWPIGEVGEPDFHFCNFPRSRGSYCAEHAKK
jgi:hypothetical protein